jgi:hypothetical protein
VESETQVINLELMNRGLAVLFRILDEEVRESPADDAEFCVFRTIVTEDSGPT